MSEKTTQLELAPIYFTYYQIESSLGSRENDRYCVEIKAEIKINEPGDQVHELVGVIQAFKILIGEGAKNGWEPYAIFDTTAQTFEIAEAIYDLQAKKFKTAIETHYQEDLIGTDILILNNIEILPKYRRQGIGAKAIKDLYNHFIGGCALFVLQCFPNQQTYAVLESTEEFTKRMEYENLEKNTDVAFNSLSSYFRSIGFETIPRVNKAFMFINPEISNSKFEAIAFDD